MTGRAFKQMGTDRNRRQSQQFSRWPDHRGQSLVEFALTMPLLLALLVGVILLAWVGFTYFSMASAARMGARHMVSYPEEPEDVVRFASADAEITYIVTSSMPYLDWRQAGITLVPEAVDQRTVFNPESPNEPNYAVVRVAYPVNLPTVRIPDVLAGGSFVLLGPVNLEASARMRFD